MKSMILLRYGLLVGQRSSLVDTVDETPNTAHRKRCEMHMAIDWIETNQSYSSIFEVQVVDNKHFFKINLVARRVTQPFVPWPSLFPARISTSLLGNFKVLSNIINNLCAPVDICVPP